MRTAGMTAEQQREVVRARKARGFPLHRPPHRQNESGWYLVSTATYEHREHLRAADELTALENQLREALEGSSIPCAAWVVMPNHYHVLVRLSNVSIFGRAVGAVHGRSSRYVNARDEKLGRRVWCNYSDRKVRNERHFWTCMHYIIRNPVKHGFTDDALAWPWSCIHELLAEYGSRWIDDLQREYPLRDFGKGWDDWSTLLRRE